MFIIINYLIMLKLEMFLKDVVLAKCLPVCVCFLYICIYRNSSLWMWPQVLSGKDLVLHVGWPILENTLTRRGIRHYTYSTANAGSGSGAIH